MKKCHSSFILFTSILLISGCVSQSTLRLGEEGLLGAQTEFVAVVVDSEALNEMLKHLENDDTTQFNSMLDRGKLFSVKGKTRVKVISIQSDAAQIEILDGDQAGKTGWTSTELITRD